MEKMAAPSDPEIPPPRTEAPGSAVGARLLLFAAAVVVVEEEAGGAKEEEEEGEEGGKGDATRDDSPLE